MTDVLVPPTDAAVSAAGGPHSRWAAARRLRSFRTISLVVAIILGLLGLVPLLRVVLRLFYDGGFTAEPLRKTLDQPDLGPLMLNTVGLVVVSGVIALVVGSVLAWLNERTDARMGFVSDLLPIIPFLLPPVAAAVGWVLLFSPQAGFLNAALREVLGTSAGQPGLPSGPFDIFTWYGLVLAYAIFGVPFVFLLVSSGLRGIDPSLEEQSRMVGAGMVRTLFRVTLPALKPSLGGAALLVVWQGLALYSVPAIIGTTADIDVLAVRIVRLTTFTYPPETDVAVGLSCVTVAIVGGTYLLQRRVTRKGRYAVIGGKGHRVSRVELGRWRWPARAVVILYALIAAILPVAALLIVSLNGFWTPNINWTGLGLTAWREAVFEDVATRKAVVNSLLLGLAGATVAMAGAAVVALLVRRGGLAARLADGAIKMPAAVANIVLAVGIILVFGGSPFFLGGTLAILLIGYVALYIPEGSVTADSAAAQVGGELAEASEVSGAGGGRTFRKIFIPLMGPGLIVGWALLFVRMVGDLTASALLAGGSNPVVGRRILEVYEFGSYSLLASLSITLVLITSTVLLLVTALAKRRSRWQRQPALPRAGSHRNLRRRGGRDGEQ